MVDAGPAPVAEGVDGSPVLEIPGTRMDGGRRIDAALVVAALIGAFVLRFVQDDGFISFRYSRNLARGEGLVFNPDERVEGYTNFLWTALHALPERLGWSTPWFSVVVGLACLAGTVLVALSLARNVLGARRGAIAGVALVANVTFLGYGTGGLETMLQALLCTSVFALLLPLEPAEGRLRRWSAPTREVAAGFLAGLAVLTRMDSAVYLAVVGAAYLALGHRAGTTPRRLAASVARIAVPGLVVVVPWLAWKVSFYGSIIPNTAVAKEGGSKLAAWAYGVGYLVAFALTYAAVLLIPRLWRKRRELPALPAGGALVAVCVVWCLYIVYVGADFMEYRFMVPILPLLAVVLAVVIDEVRSVRGHVLLVGALLAASAFHAVQPKELSVPVLPFSNLRHWPTGSPTSWQAMGEVLARAFPGRLGDPGRPVIAIAPVGVIPYESDLETIDLLGLTDATIAREGTVLPIYFPGHVRMSEVPYLVERGVNLVIGHPHTDTVDPDRMTYRLSELVPIHPGVDLRRLPEGARVIEIPLVDDIVWTVIALVPGNGVTEAAAANGWRMLPIERTCADEDLPNAVVRIMAEATCPQA